MNLAGARVLVTGGGRGIGRRLVEGFLSDGALVGVFERGEDLCAELRTAFDAMMRDPELRAEAAKVHLDVDPVSGSELQTLVGRLYETPPDVIDIVKKINTAR